MDDSCGIQEIIHLFSLVHKYVSRILGTYHFCGGLLYFVFLLFRLFFFQLQAFLVRSHLIAVKIKIANAACLLAFQRL